MLEQFLRDGPRLFQGDGIVDKTAKANGEKCIPVGNVKHEESRSEAAVATPVNICAASPIPETFSISPSAPSPLRGLGSLTGSLKIAVASLLSMSCETSGRKSAAKSELVRPTAGKNAPIRFWIDIFSRR